MASFRKLFHRKHKNRSIGSSEPDEPSQTVSSATSSPILVEESAADRQSIKLSSSNEIQDLLSTFLKGEQPKLPVAHSCQDELAPVSVHGEICTVQRVSVNVRPKIIEVTIKKPTQKTSCSAPAFGSIRTKSVLGPRYQSRISSFMAVGRPIDRVQNLNAIYAWPEAQTVAQPRQPSIASSGLERCPSLISQSSSVTFSDYSIKAPSVASSTTSATNSEASFYSACSSPKVLTRNKALSTSLLLRRQRIERLPPNLDIPNPNTLGTFGSMSGPYPMVRSRPPSRSASGGNRNSRVIPLSLPYNDPSRA